MTNAQCLLPCAARCRVARLRQRARPAALRGAEYAVDHALRVVDAAVGGDVFPRDSSATNLPANEWSHDTLRPPISSAFSRGAQMQRRSTGRSLHGAVLYHYSSRRCPHIETTKTARRSCERRFTTTHYSCFTTTTLRRPRARRELRWRGTISRRRRRPRRETPSSTGGLRQPRRPPRTLGPSDPGLEGRQAAPE
jgi:hypothetical protein